MKVKDFVKDQDVVTAERHEPLSAVVELMRRKKVSGIPIVDEWGELCGLVTATDVVRLSSPAVHLDVHVLADGGWSPAQHTVEHDPNWEKVPANDVMVTDLCTVSDEDDIQEAARTMTNRRVHRAIVLGEDRNVHGVISAMDMTVLVAEHGLGS